MEENILKLRELFSKKTLTPEDKNFVKELSKELNVSFSYRPNCKNCYPDQVVILLNYLQKDNDVNPADVSYTLKEPFASTGLYYNGQYIDQENITDKIAQKMISKGLHKYFVNKK